jgi:peptidoglycan/LPS O-acetylase OafA/YrhL
MIQTFGILIVDIFFGLLVMKFIKIGNLQNNLFNRIFINLGKYCYAIYLLHPSILHRVEDKVTLLHFTFFGFENYIKYFLCLGLTTILSYVVALISWNLYEKHFIKLKKYFN